MEHPPKAPGVHPWGGTVTKARERGEKCCVTTCRVTSSSASHCFSSCGSAGSLGSSQSASREPLVAGKQQSCDGSNGVGGCPTPHTPAPHRASLERVRGRWVMLYNYKTALTQGASAVINCPVISQRLMCSFPTEEMLKKGRAVLFKTGFI